MSLGAAIRLDVRLQARSKLYAIGVGAAVALGLLVRALIPPEHMGRGLAGFYLLAMGGTTFMFGASMVLLERSERTLEALRVTPLRPQTYLLAKAITLTAFALVEGAIVFAIAVQGAPFHPGWLLLGALVLGVLYTLVGLGLVAAYDAVTTFLLPAGVAASIALQLPALSLIGLGPDWLYCPIPSYAPLLLLRGAFEPLPTWQWVYALATSALCLPAAAWWCRRRFAVHLGLGEAP